MDVFEDSVWEPVAVLQQVWGLMYLDEMLAPRTYSPLA